MPLKIVMPFHHLTLELDAKTISTLVFQLRHFFYFQMNHVVVLRVLHMIFNHETVVVVAVTPKFFSSSFAQVAPYALTLVVINGDSKSNEENNPVIIIVLMKDK